METKIQASIKAWLQYHRFDVERINSTPIYVKKTGKFRKNHMTPGISDLWYYRRDATGWLEVKTPADYAYIMKHYQKLKNGLFSAKNKKLMRFHSQIHFLEKKSSQGMICGFVDGIDRVKELFEKNGIEILELKF